MTSKTPEITNQREAPKQQETTPKRDFIDRISFLRKLREKAMQSYIEKNGFNPYTEKRGLNLKGAPYKHKKPDFEEEEEREMQELAEVFKRKIAQSGGRYSETIQIGQRGNLITYDQDGNLKSIFAHQAENAEALYELAQGVQKLSPDLNFQFEQDPEGKWIKYSVENKAA